jgi:hypothetical protein
MIACPELERTGRPPGFRIDLGNVFVFDFD